MRGRTGRVHVVHEAHRSRCWSRRDDAPSNVPAPVGECEAALPPKRPRAPEEIDQRHIPDASQLDRERARRNVTALPGSFRVTGNVREHVDVGRPDDLGHESCRLVRKLTPAVLLPLPHERSRPLVVDHPRPRPRERKPAAGALGAAPDRPVARRPAALAHGRQQAAERSSTGRAQRGTRACADRAALREEQVERTHTMNGTRQPATGSRRLRVRSTTPRATREGRPEHARGRRAS